MSRINVANFRHPDGTSDNITLDDSGRVLIGTSTAGAFANRRATIATTSGTTALELRSATNGDSRIVFTDSTDSGDAGSYKGQILYDQSSDYMSFNTNGNNERMRITSTGDLRFNSGFGSAATAYGVRAWIYFDGELASIGTGLGSAGVSSVTDHAVGEYTINFSFTFPDINYCVVTGLGDRESNNDAGYLQTHATAIQTTTTFRFRTVNYAYTTTADCEDVSLAFIR